MSHRLKQRGRALYHAPSRHVDESASTPSTSELPERKLGLLPSHIEKPLHGDIRIAGFSSLPDPYAELQHDYMVLGKEKDDNLIGSGSYGRVYKVKVRLCSEKTGRLLEDLYSGGRLPRRVRDSYPVAVKVFSWVTEICECSFCEVERDLKKLQLRNPRFKHKHPSACSTVESFYREVNSLLHLIGVVGLQQIIAYEVDQAKFTARLITRLEGEPLKEVLEKRFPMSYATKNPEIPLVIFALTMQAVANMHSQMILHGDMSPKNLLFDHYLNPVCIDFGFSRVISFDPKTGREVPTFEKTGTQLYAAPEAWDNDDSDGSCEGFTSTKGDVYAVAAVLFHTIFRKRVPAKRLRRRGPMGWWGTLLWCEDDYQNPAMKLVLALYGQCLQVDPLMRPSAATAVQRAREFARHIMPPDRYEALVAVLNGTSRQYPWYTLCALIPPDTEAEIDVSDPQRGKMSPTACAS